MYVPCAYNVCIYVMSMYVRTHVHIYMYYTCVRVRECVKFCTY